MGGTSLADDLGGFAAGGAAVDKDYVFVFWDCEGGMLGGYG